MTHTYTFKKWLEELDAICEKEIGFCLADMEDVPTRDLYEDGYSPRAAFEIFCAEYWFGTDEGYYSDEPATDAAGNCFTDADPGL